MPATRLLPRDPRPAPDPPLVCARVAWTLPHPSHTAAARPAPGLPLVRARVALTTPHLPRARPPHVRASLHRTTLPRIPRPAVRSSVPPYPGLLCAVDWWPRRLTPSHVVVFLHLAHAPSPKPPLPLFSALPLSLGLDFITLLPVTTHCPTSRARACGRVPPKAPPSSFPRPIHRLATFVRMHA